MGHLSVSRRRYALSHGTINPLQPANVFDIILEAVSNVKRSVVDFHKKKENMNMTNAIQYSQKQSRSSLSDSHWRKTLSVCKVSKAFL
ncbi:unnamed protein product [Larinioides sclopetarius]|uniref:Uncharacterized protein n=1 Tax=Larinioides sclopetarius TaxID=280406 RepID=A0AAV1ZRY4_9ARAC